ncbi:hypothetical protein ACOSQ3_002940 [Xanthoceras sorbifolium]
MYSNRWDPNFPPPHQFIYEIPKFFKKCNLEMFTPMLFSIGHFHHGRLELAAMESRKKRYYEKFDTLILYEILEKFEFVLQLGEAHFPSTYIYSVPTVPIQLDEFRSIICYDSIFIVELLLSYYEKENNGLLSDSLKKNALIKRDLLLLENQLPFYILIQLYNLVLSISPYQGYHSFLNLSCNFFGIKFVISSLVGVIPSDPRKTTGTFLSLPTAKELKKLEVKCTSKRFIIKLFILQIPCIELNILSECMFQNVRAFELLAYDLLEEDLNVLMTENIISNELEDEADIVKLFQRVTKGCLVYPKCDVWGICESLRSLVNS